MRDYALGTTFDLKFTTRKFSTGAPFTLAGTPSVAAYPDNSTTEVTAGITLSTDFDSVTGLNNVRVVATSGNGYASGSNYALVITAGTVDSVSVVGEVIGEFSLEAQSPLRPTTTGRTLDVTATGEGGIDWANIGSPTTTVNLSGTSTLALEPTTAGRKLDVTTTGEAGIDWANVGSPTTTVGLTGTTISTSQVVASVTGAVGSVTGAVGSVTGNVGGNVTGSVGSVVGAVGSVTGNVGGNVTGSVGSVATGGIAAASFAAGAIDATAIASNAIAAAQIASGAITAAKFAASAIDAAALATDAVDEIRDAIFARTFSAAYNGLTFDEICKVLVASQGGKTDGGATTTFHIRSLDDSQNTVTATVDADGNRSAVTLNP